MILGNLLDEENSEFPHPVLWLDFAEALGLDRAAVQAGTPGPAAQELVREFQALTASSPAEGLGAILAYESQVPEVARFKTKSLKQHYLSSEMATKGARFFAVHEEADVWHTQALEGVIAKFSDGQKHQAREGAARACSALWRFLDAMPY